jgi:hypothetical protein
MPSSAVQNFTDPDVFASSVRAARAELTFIGRGQFAATLTQVTFSDLWMQRFSDNLSRVMHSAIVTGRAIISFGTQPGPGLFLGGVEMTRCRWLSEPAPIRREMPAGSLLPASALGGRGVSIGLPMLS